MKDVKLKAGDGVKSSLLTVNRRRVYITDITTKKFGLYTRISLDIRLTGLRDYLVKQRYSYMSNTQFLRFSIKGKNVEDCIKMIMDYLTKKEAS